MSDTTRMSDASGLPDEASGERAQTREAPDGTDRRLVRRCAQSDPAALRELVERYQQKLYRFSRDLLGSHEDAEEAVLDVFLRVWQQAHRFEGRASVATWLYRIAANAACDRLRRRKGQPGTLTFAEGWAAEALPAQSVNAEEIALDRLEQQERAARLQQALPALRVDDRLLLTLYYQEEMSYEEIGQITRHATPVLKMRLLRARRRLRVLLDAATAEGSR